MNRPYDLALPELLAPWLTRRSISPKHLEDPGPGARELECLLRAAFTGPDHARLRFCRLKPLNHAQRERLATAFQNYRREADGALRGCRRNDLRCQSSREDTRFGQPDPRERGPV